MPKTTEAARREVEEELSIHGEVSVRPVGILNDDSNAVGAVHVGLVQVLEVRGDVKIRVNSRAMLEESLRAGVLRDRPELFEPLCVVIDKLGKIGADAVVELLTKPDGEIRLDEGAAREVVDMLAHPRQVRAVG